MTIAQPGRHEKAPMLSSPSLRFFSNPLERVLVDIPILLVSLILLFLSLSSQGLHAWHLDIGP